MGSDVAARIADAVDSEQIVVRPFDGFIFLCGGAIESSDNSIASARHYSLSKMDAEGKIGGRRVVIAEKMTSLMQGDDYQDLLEFEEHIAALCACVLIFVESPGSIAELGSFSVMRNLAPRLLVVCEQRYDSIASPSFIFLGPIASLRRRRIESVQVFPILSDKAGALRTDTVLLDDCWQYINEAVLESLHRPIPESSLVKTELSHQMVLVAEIVDLAAAIKLGEIEEALAAFDVEVRGKALRRILRILEQFELVVSRSYGNERFYHSLLKRSLIGFRPKPTGDLRMFDSVRFKASMLEHFSTTDERRSKAIRSFLRSVKS